MPIEESEFEIPRDLPASYDIHQILRVHQILRALASRSRDPERRTFERTLLDTVAVATISSITVTIGPSKFQTRPSSLPEAPSRAHRAAQPTTSQALDLLGSQDRGGKAIPAVGVGVGVGAGAGVKTGAATAVPSDITTYESYELDDYQVIATREVHIAREERRKAKRDKKRRWLDEQDEMKFSHSIQFNAVPDWSSHYLAYSNLKKLSVPLFCSMILRHMPCSYPNIPSLYLESTNSRRPSIKQGRPMSKQDLFSGRRTPKLCSVER